MSTQSVCFGTVLVFLLNNYLDALHLDNCLAKTWSFSCWQRDAISQSPSALRDWSLTSCSSFLHESFVDKRCRSNQAQKSQFGGSKLDQIRITRSFCESVHKSITSLLLQSATISSLPINPIHPSGERNRPPRSPSSQQWKWDAEHSWLIVKLCIRKEVQWAHTEPSRAPHHCGMECSQNCECKGIWWNCSKIISSPRLGQQRRSQK